MLEVGTIVRIVKPENALYKLAPEQLVGGITHIKQQGDETLYFVPISGYWWYEEELELEVMNGKVHTNFRVR